MVYEPLHHKYRPQSFAQLVGQSAIATTLCSALQQQRIPPAYLFCGPRGTGKTSSARILAKSLNCVQTDNPTPTPCGQCETCRSITKGSALDVIEIDAASNTGVDNIRELIERAQFAPVQCRYKVYVIDECHMLSTAAFNALLKTLEEPPERVVFVLATTDPQRVLPTIISRCQRFDFRRIPLEEMVAHLQTIANQEGIQIEPDALRLVAQVSQGGLRDAQSLLDQLSLLTEGVTVERVWDLVGAVPERNLLALVRAIAADDGVQVLEQARHLMDRGREPLVVLQNLASFYRDLLVAKTACDRNDLVAITPSTWAELVDFTQSLDLGLILAGQQRLREAEVQVKNTTQPRLWLEVTLLGLLPSTLAAQTVAASLDTRSALPSRRELQPTAPTAPTAPAKSPSPQVPVSAVHPAPVASLEQNGAGAAQPTAPAASATVQSAAAPSAQTVPAQPVQTAPNDSAGVDSPHTQPPKAPPAPVPTPAQPAVPESSPPVPQVNIREIWQQVIGRLHPLSKALLKEHGELLEYTGNQATVAISSRNLLKIAQSKVPDIEKAFALVVNHPIRISLTVAADVSASSPPASADLDASPSSAVAPIGQPATTSDSGSSQNGSSIATSTNGYSNQVTEIDTQNGAWSSATVGETSSETITQPASTSLPPAARTASDADLPQSNEAVSAPGSAFESVGPMPSVYTEDAVARASRSFAQFFNGQVVEMNEADAMFWSATADLAQSTSVAPTNSTGSADLRSHSIDHAVVSSEEIRDRDRTFTSTATSLPTPSADLSTDDDDDDDDLPF
ncbi:MAG: DNA polymerase III subunit gamma/tau [Thainema sp.]